MSFNFKAFRKDFEKAVQQVESKYNLKISIGSIRYDSSQFTSRLTAVHLSDEVDPDNKKDVQKALFEANCDKMWPPIPKELYGKKFTHSGTTFTVIGVKPRSKKYPIIAENKNGTSYKFTLDAVNHNII